MRLSLIVAISFLVLTSVGRAANPKQKPAVFTEIAKTTEISDQLTYPARIDSKVNAKIFAEADGVVTKIVVPLGERVKRNSTILLIKNMEPGYSYAPMRLTSPVNGVVSQVKVTEGTQVTRGQEIAAVTDPSALKIAIEVSASDIGSFKKGLKGELYLPEQESAVPVEVAGVSPLVDPMTGTACAELKIVPLPKKAAAGKVTLTPGLIGQARFKVNSRKGFSLPENAIVYHGENTLVRMVIGGRSKLAPVKLGRKKQGNVEILSGVKDGDQVIDRASTYVGEGDEVDVQKSDSGESTKL